MIDGITQCNCRNHFCKKSVRTNKQGNIVEIINGDDKYILCGPAEKNRRFIPTIYNGQPIHITKEEAITLLISAAAKCAYSNIDD